MIQLTYNILLGKFLQDRTYPYQGKSFFYENFLENTSVI